MPSNMYNLTKEVGTHSKEIQGFENCITWLAFINNSDDTRNTPSEPYFDMAEKDGAVISIHDPYVSEYGSLKISRILKSVSKGPMQ